MKPSRLILKNHGFTLVESMVVVAILVILGTVAFASFGTWTKTSKVNGAARQLYSELNLARMKAISKNKNYVTTFDSNTHCYTITASDGTDVKGVCVGTQFADIVFGFVAGTKKAVDVATALVAGDEISLDDDQITFQPTGLVLVADLPGGDGSEEGVLYLMPEGETEKKFQRAVSVNLLGRARLWLHTGTQWE